MPTQILAAGTDAANSADVVVTSSGLTVGMKDAAGPLVDSTAFITILLKDDAGEYFRVGQLDYRNPALVIVAAGNADTGYTIARALKAM